MHDTDIMEVTLYRSFLCPRCYMAARHLRSIAGNDPSLQITEREVGSHPVRIWRQGIRMIPALQIGRQTLSGIYLSKKQIESFIKHSKLNSQKDS